MAGVGRFDWGDPFLLDDQLFDDERMIRDTACAYAQDKLAPRIVEAFQHEHTDPSIFREMGELDLLGPTNRRNTAASMLATSPTAVDRRRSLALIAKDARLDKAYAIFQQVGS